MKCEKCGKEANFYYSSTINGQHEEHCLCADCAKEAGFENAFEFAFSPMGLLAQACRTFDGSFPVMRRTRPLFDSFGRGWWGIMPPMLVEENFFNGAPWTPQAAPMSEAETKVPEDAGEDVKARREREALKQQLQEAVAAEDFEKAIELRDQLKKLEG